MKMPVILTGRKCPDCGESLVREENPYGRVRCTGDGHIFEFSCNGISVDELSREERLAKLEWSLSVYEDFQVSEHGRQILKELFGDDRLATDPAPTEVRLEADH